VVPGATEALLGLIVIDCNVAGPLLGGVDDEELLVVPPPQPAINNTTDSIKKSVNFCIAITSGNQGSDKL
jgi:hypothetical protein